MALLLAAVPLGAAACNSILGNDAHSLAGVDGSTASDGEVSHDGSPNADGSASPDGSAVADSSASPDAPAETAAADAASDGGCMDGNLRCSGNTPQECVGGVWQDQMACGGATPVCSNGACGTYRTTGGILSTAPTPVAGDGGIRLVSGGFELGARSCDEAGVCVTGGIVP
jgi:hypothetical protein